MREAFPSAAGHRRERTARDNFGTGTAICRKFPG